MRRSGKIGPDAYFLGELPVYLSWPDRARLVPQVLRLAMARDDADLARIPFDAGA